MGRCGKVREGAHTRSRSLKLYTHALTLSHSHSQSISITLTSMDHALTSSSPSAAAAALASSAFNACSRSAHPASRTSRPTWRACAAALRPSPPARGWEMGMLPAPRAPAAARGGARVEPVEPERAPKLRAVLLVREVTARSPSCPRIRYVAP